MPDGSDDREATAPHRAGESRTWMLASAAISLAGLILLIFGGAENLGKSADAIGVFLFIPFGVAALSSALSRRRRRP